MKEQEVNQTKKNILEQISSGQVKMKPRWQFVLRTVLLGIGIILAALAIIYFASLTVFVLRLQGILFVPTFGIVGIYSFINSAPWLFILITIAFVIVLQILVHKYQFVYGKPLFYSIAALMVLVLISVILIEQTSLHPGLYSQSKNGRFPFLGGIYEHPIMMHMPQNVTAGLITEIVDPGMKIKTNQDVEYIVLIGQNTKMPYNQEFDIGDMVVVLGNREDGRIQAVGIRSFDDHLEHPKPVPGMKGMMYR